MCGECVDREDYFKPAPFIGKEVDGGTDNNWSVFRGCDAAKPSNTSQTKDIKPINYTVYWLNLLKLNLCTVLRCGTGKKISRMASKTSLFWQIENI